MSIIDSRWDNQLHKNVHATGFWLNPACQYNSTELGKHRYTTSGLLDVIEKYSYGNPDLMSHLTSKMKLVRKTEGDFGRFSAIRDRNAMLPGIRISELQTRISFLIIRFQFHLLIFFTYFHR